MMKNFPLLPSPERRNQQEPSGTPPAGLIPFSRLGFGYPALHTPLLLDVMQLLGPPLPATRSLPPLFTVEHVAGVVEAQESFQVVSGMYPLADACPGVVFVVFQYGAGLFLSSKSVPPTATLNGVEANPLTASPLTADVSVFGSSQPADPLSPLAIKTVIPSEAACCHRELY